MSIVIVLCLTIVFLFTVSLYFTIQRRNYWKKRNVPYLKSKFFFGNYGEYIMSNKYIGEVMQDICRQLPDSPYVGVFYGTKPALVVQDPDIIKLITVKDFNCFNGREVSDYTHKEIVTRNLFFTNGSRWNAIRPVVSSLFSSSKLKNMFYLIQKCNQDLELLLKDETAISETIDVRFLMACYTMDCVMSCTVGIETKTMDKSIKNNPFTAMGETVFEKSNVRFYKLLARALWPSVFYGLGLQVYPNEIDMFFRGLARSICESRNYKSSQRNDFIDLFLNLKNNKKQDAINGFQFDEDMLTGQCAVLFSAGFETTAGTLSHILYELAKNDEAQARVLAEVDNYLLTHEKGAEFDCLTQLPYLDACMSEAMRLYPALGMITREVMVDYTLPSGVKLDKGLRVHLPVYHLHLNPDLFPQPEKYMPERFLPENKSNIQSYTYMPFGEGPRTCVGLRMAKLMILSGLVAIFKNYRLEVTENTPRSLHFEPRAFVTVAKEKILLNFVRRTA